MSSKTCSRPTWRISRSSTGGSTRNARRRCTRSAPPASTSLTSISSEEVRAALSARGDSELPPGPDLPGGSLHRLSLPLDFGRHLDDGARRTTHLASRDRADQQRDQRGQKKRMTSERSG